MEFEVGDVLVDAGNDPTDKLRSATVIDFIENDTGQYYRLQHHQGFDDWLEAEEVEYEWKKAPLGSVGWLIKELSKHSPSEMVYYLGGDFGFAGLPAYERVEEISERASGGIIIC